MEAKEISILLESIYANHGGDDLFLEKNKAKFSGLVADYFREDQKVSRLIKLCIDEDWFFD